VVDSLVVRYIGTTNPATIRPSPQTAARSSATDGGRPGLVHAVLGFPFGTMPRSSYKLLPVARADVDRPEEFTLMPR
jgi:hypothetical protein